MFCSLDRRRDEQRGGDSWEEDSGDGKSCKWDIVFVIAQKSVIGKGEETISDLPVALYSLYSPICLSLPYIFLFSPKFSQYPPYAQQFHQIDNITCQITWIPWGCCAPNPKSLC